MYIYIGVLLYQDSDYIMLLSGQSQTKKFYVHFQIYGGMTLYTVLKYMHNVFTYYIQQICFCTPTWEVQTGRDSGVFWRRPGDQ